MILFVVRNAVGKKRHMDMNLHATIYEIMETGIFGIQFIRIVELFLTLEKSNEETFIKKHIFP